MFAGSSLRQGRKSALNLGTLAVACRSVGSARTDVLLPKRSDNVEQGSPSQGEYTVAATKGLVGKPARLRSKKGLDTAA